MNGLNSELQILEYICTENNNNIDNLLHFIEEKKISSSPMEMMKKFKRMGLISCGADSDFKETYRPTEIAISLYSSTHKKPSFFRGVVNLFSL